MQIVCVANEALQLRQGWKEIEVQGMKALKFSYTWPRKLYVAHYISVVSRSVFSVNKKKRLTVCQLCKTLGFMSQTTFLPFQESFSVNKSSSA